MKADTKPELIIVGAGLNGLLLAYLLQSRYSITLLEARPRIGGRILSFESDSEQFDLGPTWVWPHQRHILALAETLRLSLLRHYDQGAFAYDAPEGVQYFRSENMAPSYRFEGGATMLTEALATCLDTVDVKLETPIERIETDSEGVTVVSGNRCFRAGHCIVTLPPRLSAALTYKPAADAAALAQMQHVPTWMGFSAKCVITYAEPFWRKEGLSGFATSHLGPLSEVHDASAGSKGALFGFYHTAFADEAQPERVVAQLERIFGPKAAQYDTFRYHNWRTDGFTSVPADRAPLREHPRYGPSQTWSPRLHFSGTETAVSEGGYLEGAVIAAFELAKKLTPS